MTIATIVLVFITSAGIFGYLSNAYQGATLEFEKQSTELIAVEERIEQLEDDKIFLKEELSVAISELPDNYITAKRKLREDYNPQILSVNEEILNYKKTRADLEIQLVSTGVDVGPAIYLARTFGTDIDTVVKFFIFILIFVFDPLAVMLVIAYNQALIDRTTRKEDNVPAGGSINIESASANNPNPYGDDDYATPIVEDDEDFSVEEEMIEEDDERMDIIGQNGNDGLHYDNIEPSDDNNPNPQILNPQPTARGGVRIK